MASVKGLLVEIGGDTSKLQKALKDVDKTTGSLSKELRGINTLLKFDPKSTELLKQKQVVLNQEIISTEDKLKSLKEAQELANQDFTKVSQESYRNLQREIILTEQQLNKLKTETSKWTTVGKNIEDVGSKITNISGKIGNIGSTLNKTVTPGIIGTATVAITAMDKVDEGLDTIATKTGATGESAKELQKIYKEVASQVPADFGDIGSAIGEINTRLDLTGDKLKVASIDFLKFAKVNEIDVNSSVKLVTRAMGDAGIETDKYSELLDMLTVAGQKSGISIDALSTNLAKYGAPMRALGIDTQNAIAMFAGWEKAGVNTEIAFSGMKKAISNWGASGKDATKEFSKTLEEIKKCPTIAKATTKAIEVFGAKAGPDLADAIKGGRFEFEEYIQALKNSKGTIESTYGQIVDEVDDAQIAMQNLQLAMHDSGEVAAKTLGPELLKLSENFKGLMEKFDKLDPKMKENIVRWGAIVAIAGPVLSVTSKVGNAIGNTVKGIGTFSQAISVAKNNTESTNASVNKLASGIKLFTSPLTLSIGAIGATISVLSVWREASLANYKALKQEGDQLRANIQAREEESKQLEKDMNAKLSEIANVQGLSKELDNLVDKNGKIKSGYEDRVNFILKELNSALGTEYKANNGIIKQYKKMQEEISNTIKVKQVEAIMNKKQAEYDKAIASQIEDEKTLAEAKQKQIKSANELKNKLKEIGVSAEDTNRILKGEMNIPYMGYRTFEVEGLVKSYQELTGEVETANNQVKKNATAIADYEYANQKYAQGGVDAILKMSEDTLKATKNINALIGGENENLILNQQDRIKRYTELLQQDLDNGIKIADSKYNYQVEKEKQALANYAQSLAQQTSLVQENSPDVVQAWKALADNSYETYSQTVAKMPPDMQRKIQEITGVIADGTPAAENMTKTLGEKIVTQLDISSNTRTKAIEALQAYIRGLDNEKQRELLKQAGIDNVEIVLNELNKGNLSEENGKNILKGLYRGISNKGIIGNILGVASNLANAVNKCFTGKDGWDEHSPSKKMEKYTNYYLDPITNVIEKRKNEIQNKVRQLANGINENMQYKFTNDFKGIQTTINREVFQSTKTIYTTPNLTIYVDGKMDNEEINKMVEQINIKLGSRY